MNCEMEMGPVMPDFKKEAMDFITKFERTRTGEVVRGLKS